MDDEVFKKTYKSFFAALKKLYKAWGHFTYEYYFDVFSKVHLAFSVIMTNSVVFWQCLLNVASNKKPKGMSKADWDVNYYVEIFIYFMTPCIVYGILLLFVFFSKKILLSMRITVIEARGGIRVGPRNDFRNYVKELDKSPQFYDLVDEHSLRFIRILLGCDVNLLRKFADALNAFLTRHSFLALINLFEEFFINPLGRALHPKAYEPVFKMKFDIFGWGDLQLLNLYLYIRNFIKQWRKKRKEKIWEISENRRKYVEKNEKRYGNR